MSTNSGSPSEQTPSRDAGDVASSEHVPGAAANEYWSSHVRGWYAWATIGFGAIVVVTLASALGSIVPEFPVPVITSASAQGEGCPAPDPVTGEINLVFSGEYDAEGNWHSVYENCFRPNPGLTVVSKPDPCPLTLSGVTPSNCSIDMGPGPYDFAFLGGPYPTVNLFGRPSSALYTAGATYDGGEGLNPKFPDGTVCIDAATYRNSGDKGLGVFFLGNSGGLSIACIMTDQAADDRIKCFRYNPTAVTVQGVPPKGAVLWKQWSRGNSAATIPYNFLDIHDQAKVFAHCGRYYNPNGGDPKLPGHNYCVPYQLCATVNADVPNKILDLKIEVRRHVPLDPSPSGPWNSSFGQPLLSSPIASGSYRGAFPPGVILAESGEQGFFGYQIQADMTASIHKYFWKPLP